MQIGQNYKSLILKEGTEYPVLKQGGLNIESFKTGLNMRLADSTADGNSKIKGTKPLPKDVRPKRQTESPAAVDNSALSYIAAAAHKPYESIAEPTAGAEDIPTQMVEATGLQLNISGLQAESFLTGVEKDVAAEVDFNAEGFTLQQPVNPISDEARTAKNELTGAVDNAVVESVDIIRRNVDTSARTDRTTEKMPTEERQSDVLQSYVHAAQPDIRDSGIEVKNEPNKYAQPEDLKVATEDIRSNDVKQDKDSEDDGFGSEEKANTHISMPRAEIKADTKVEKAALDELLVNEELRADVIDQITDYISSRPIALDRSIELVINPESMGKITLTAKSIAGGIAVSIACDNHKTYRLVSEQSEQLAGIMQKRLEEPVVVNVQNEDPDYLNQNRQQSGQGRHYQSDDNQRNRHEAESFLARLKLGLE